MNEIYIQAVWPFSNFLFCNCGEPNEGLPLSEVKVNLRLRVRLDLHPFVEHVMKASGAWLTRLHNNRTK